MWMALATVLHGLGVFSALNAVMTTRTPQGAIAWAISLVTCPYIALPAYWLFGRNRFLGYVTARRSKNERVQRRLREVLNTLTSFGIPENEISAAAAAAERLADLPFLGGNSIELLIDGQATFNSVLEGVRAAREYVLFPVH